MNTDLEMEKMNEDRRIVMYMYGAVWRISVSTRRPVLRKYSNGTEPGLGEQETSGAWPGRGAELYLTRN
jgi:hypothetical protein